MKRLKVNFFMKVAFLHISLNIFTVGIQFSDRAMFRENIGIILFLSELDSWARNIEINFDSIVDTEQHRFFALKLLHHYRHLNEEDFINLFCTDFITHKIRLVSGTKSSNLLQIKWPAHKKWWLRKLVSNDLKKKIYEHIEKNNEHLFKWNARAVLVNKTENLSFSDEPRFTFDYFRVHEKLFEIYVKLSFRIHDNLFNFFHECLFSADLKHVYFIINLDEKARPLFAFTISDMKQLQPTRMPQGSKSANFIMTEIINKAFDEISEEFFFLHFAGSFQSSNLCFYMNDFFDNQASGFFFLYRYLKHHFFSRLEWARLKLFFKKLNLWCIKIKALKVIYEIKKKIHILKNRVQKIMKFSKSRNAIAVRRFIEILNITRKWIRNFSKLAKFLFRLTEKILWKWKNSKKLFFELLKLKAAVVITMHEISLFDLTHFYIDAFEFEKRLIITQKRNSIKFKQFLKVSILYDSIIFTSFQRKYVIYKRELCAMIKLIIKYDYLAKHSYHVAIIHTDHKFLTHFFTSINDIHENIYEHWTNQLKRLNVIIKYISEQKNKIVDEFFRILFHSSDCENEPKISECLKKLKKWIWSNRKRIDYEHLLNNFSIFERNEILKKKRLHEKPVFAAETSEKKSDWIFAYASSNWYENTYRFLEKNEVSASVVFRKTMIFRVDSDIKILWVTFRKQFMPCISEIKILRILLNVHDKNNHWKKKKILIKFRNFVYWSNQFENVAKYIAECVKCARHDSVLQFQFLHFIKIFHSFQLLSMNYIELLNRISNNNVYILHIIDYLIRFFFIYVCLSATTENIQRNFRILFTLYDQSKIFYIDRGTHFDVEKIRTFLKFHEININYSSFFSFKNTEMMKISNKFLEQVLRKQNIEWNLILISFIFQFNFRIVSHLHMSSVEIFLNLFSFNFDSIDFTFAHISDLNIKIWHDEMTNSDQHVSVVSNYFIYRA